MPPVPHQPADGSLAAQGAHAVGRFPVIIGPTAGGKSELALAVAAVLQERHGVGAEVVSADAIQVYRGLDIGSGKVMPHERRGVAHHLIDIADPREPFSVDRWLRLAEEAIESIRSRGSVPIVVGGTHLYIKALMDGLFEGPQADPALRAELSAMDAGVRRAELERVDPDAAGRIHRNDERRTVRALEVFRQTGVPISEHQRQWDRQPPRDRFLVVLDWETEAINRRINARVKGMFEAGLVEETRALLAAEAFGPTSREALGYKQVLTHLVQGISLDEVFEQVKRETRRFAKNQRTWMRRLRATPGTLVIPQPGANTAEIAQRTVQATFMDGPGESLGGGQTGDGERTDSRVR